MPSRIEAMTREPSHPGQVLKGLYLEPLGLTVTGLAEALGVTRKTVSKIVNGRGEVTPDMSLRLSRALGTTPEVWLALQRNHDLWHAARKSQAWREVKPVRGQEPASA
jgi:addiction module HigA family antidote